MDASDAERKLTALIAELRKRCLAADFNYFTLMGLSLTATQKEIETAYGLLVEALSEERLAALGESETARQGRALLTQLRRAYQVLSDYGLRGEYEKRGFKEYIAPDLKEDPTEYAKSLYRKGMALYHQKNYQTAVLALADAAKLNPEKVEYVSLLGLCQSKLPALKRQAEQNLMRAAVLEPWNAEHVAALGMLFYSERLFKRAEGFFRKALELDPAHELSRRRLNDIVGPELGFSERAREKGERVLKSILPSFFKGKSK
jgi:tetratricopeptide (TPR) repeat protein